MVPPPKQSMKDILSLIEQADKPGRFDEKQLNDIVERAKVGNLNTEKVIARALSDNLIDPKDVQNCAALENIRFIDMQTITELGPAQKGCAKTQ